MLSAGPGYRGQSRTIPPSKWPPKLSAKCSAKATVFIRSGGSIPIVGEFATHLGIPTILMGFGLPDDGLHSPNEKYRISNYYHGIRTIAHFLNECKISENWVNLDKQKIKRSGA